MKRTIIFTFILSFLICTSPVFSAGIELNGIGSKATALGGNFHSIADDWSAVYWNPAGLAFTSGWNAGVNLGFVMPRASMRTGNSDYFMQTGDADYRHFSASFPEIMEAEPINFILPSFGISYSTEKWAFGIGVAVPMGWGAKWDLLQTSIAFLPNQQRPYNSQYPEFEYETDLRMLDIHPTIAYKISDKLSIGAGLSIVLGQVDIRQPVFLQNPYLYSPDIYGFVQAISDEEQTALLDQFGYPPYDHLINQVEISSTGTTFGGNIGIMFKPTKDLSVGASVQFYSDLNISGDYAQTAYFADVPELQELVEYYDEEIFKRLVNAGGLDSLNYQVVSQFFSGKAKHIVDTKAEVVLPLPLKAGIGISYSGIDNLLIAVDFAYTQWSKWDVIRINDTDGEQVSQLVQNWNDTFKYGIGLEYTINKAILRGGFSYENRAAVDEAVSPTIPDISDRYTLNLGVSIPVGPMDISIGYEHIFMADKEITDWVYDDLTVTQNIVGLYKIKANAVMFGLDYHF